MSGEKAVGAAFHARSMPSVRAEGNPWATGPLYLVVSWAQRSATKSGLPDFGQF
jgi:hypothetical protein